MQYESMSMRSMVAYLTFYCYRDELGLSNALGNLVENADESSSSSGDDYEDYWG